MEIDSYCDPHIKNKLEKVKEIFWKSNTVFFFFIPLSFSKHVNYLLLKNIVAWKGKVKGCPLGKAVFQPLNL